MPRRSKSKKLKQLEQKMKLIKKEIEKRKKMQNATSAPTTTIKKRGRKATTKTPFEECRAILDRVKKTSYSKPFLTPVDWKSMNIPTYPKIIKHPMDLSTIEQRMNGHEYSTPYDFAKDMRLVYQNACTFNKPGSPFYGAAAKFARKFEDEFDKKILDQHETNDFTKRIAKVVSILIKREDAAAFRMPVDPKVLEIPDYFDVVENPMDLGTILNEINAYTKFKEFVADLFLVWDNCCRYNPKQNAIHQQALKLRDVTTKQLNRLCQSDFTVWQEDGDRASTTPYPPSSLTMNVASMEHIEQNNHNHINNSNSSIQNHETYQEHQQTTLAPGPSANLQSDSGHDTVNSQNNQMEYNDNNSQDVEMTNNDNDNVNNNNLEEMDIFKLCDKLAETDEEEANKKMIEYLMQKLELSHDTVQSLNFTQKEELQRGIQCLDSDHFDPLIQMLQSFIPEGEGDDDEVELDVDAIDDPLQVKMYNYMLQAIHQQETERIQREGGDISMLQSQSLASQSLTQTQPQEAVSINAMEVEDQHQIQQDTNVGHMSGKGGFSNMNDENDNQMQQNQDTQMNAMETDNHDQTEEPQSTFPTSMDGTSSIPGNTEEAPQEDSAAQYTFGPTVDSNQDDQNEENHNNMNTDNNEQEVTMNDNINNDNDKAEEEEDQDIDMQNNEEAINDDEDILADIANAVDENETTSTPVLESSNTDPTQQMQSDQVQNEGVDNQEQDKSNEDNQGNDNDATDTESNDNDNNATPQPQTIPTMPELQPDSDNNASKDPPQEMMEDQPTNDDNIEQGSNEESKQSTENQQDQGQEQEQEQEHEQAPSQPEDAENAATEPPQNNNEQIPSMDNINIDPQPTTTESQQIPQTENGDDDKTDSLNNFDPNLNVNDALTNDNEDETQEREDEEVETPLADDIDF